MKITNEVFNNSYGANNQNVDLKENDIYNASIKTRLSGNEAVVKIRGTDFNVSFQGEVPKNSNISLQVLGIKNNTISVKEISQGLNGSELNAGVEDIISKLNMKVTDELKQAVKTMKDNDIPINKENLKNVEEFFSKASGETSDKLDTISALAGKGIEFSPSNLEAVHEALHGQDLDKTLAGLSSREELLTTEVIRDIRRAIASGKSLDMISEIIKEKILDKELAMKLEKVLNQVEVLKALGKEEEGLIKIVDVLNEIQGNFIEGENTIEDFNPEELQNSARLQQALTGIEPSVKAYVMTKISTGMAQATDKFKDLKREVTRNIDTMIRVTKSTNTNVADHLKGVLEKSIDIIDNAILKSEITLYTDMKTERQLLGISSQLADARRMLSKGNNSEAVKILDNVKGKLMNINWRPSENKVIHAATKDSMFTGNVPQLDNIALNLNNIVNSFQNQQPTARNTFDLFRALGLNYDSEIAQKLTGNLEELSQKDIQKNLKAILLKLTEGEGKSLQEGSSSQSIVKALNNLTGQQLLSKQDSNPHQQSMYFNIPVNIEGELKNVKLFIKGRKKSEKIDWENSNLYFMIDTKKMGPTGINISSTERNLSLTIKNDNSGLENSMTNLSDKLKQNLEEVGYNVVGFKFARLNEQSKESNQDNKLKNNFVLPGLNQKGFDYKI